ncbi:MAG TPA: O-antigen ligase family protein [Xenococcaceae cyanobacterium]|jgi:O-antigen ligase
MNNESLSTIKPQNLPEQLIWYLAIATYPLYLIGALYIVIPTMAIALSFYTLHRWYRQSDRLPKAARIWISPTAWVWLAAGIVIEIALIVGHFNFDLGLKQTIISSVNNWGRKWAMIPLLILIGHLKIRPQLLYRIACIIAVQSALMAIVGTLAAIVGIPNMSYVSPLAIFGGGENHYEVILFQNALRERIYLFAPWITAIGTLGNFFFFLAREDKHPLWRISGVVSALIMILISQSRAALLCIPFVLTVVWLVKNIFYPGTQLLISLGFFLLGLFSFPLTKALSFAREQFSNFRGRDSVYSSRVRSNLYRVTIKTWWEEAPIWGHGRISEKGPAFLFHMPIGSHNTWLGALYTFGLVGFIALAVAFLFTLFNLAIQARKSQVATVGLYLFLSLFVATFTDSIEHVAYIYWSALLFIGIALSQQETESFSFNTYN